MSHAVDFVIVPDFGSGSAALFEGRTLFFLASWIENAGSARHWPIHLACIGQPPPSVRRLAAEAGARISVHEPLMLGVTSNSNKLRGLEIESETGCLVLLDADVIVLGDLGETRKALGEGLAAAPASRARVPEELWPPIYAAVGGTVPAERMLSTRSALKAISEEQSMPPYFNSGVIGLPAGCGLRGIWEEHFVRICEAFEGRKSEEAIARHLFKSDQASLATAVQHLRTRGISFRLIPPAFHALKIHFDTGAVSFKEARLLHAIEFLRGMKSLVELEERLESYLSKWATGRAGEDGHAAPSPAAFFYKLLRQRVLPALRGSSPGA